MYLRLKLFFKFRIKVRLAFIPFSFHQLTLSQETQNCKFVSE